MQAFGRGRLGGGVWVWVWVAVAFGFGFGLRLRLGVCINAHAREQHVLFHAMGKHSNPHAARRQVTMLQGTVIQDSQQLVTRRCACILQGYRETLSVFLPGKLLTSCCAARKGEWGKRLISYCMHGQELVCLLATPKVHLADIFLHI